MLKKYWMYIIGFVLMVISFVTGLAEVNTNETNYLFVKIIWYIIAMGFFTVIYGWIIELIVILFMFSKKAINKVFFKVK